MDSKIIKTGCHGIVVELVDGGGQISSRLHENVTNEDYEEQCRIARYNDMMDALESMILAHAIAGIDITTPAYLEGIETACTACAKATE